jgi:ADP-ribose pyrophosphatase
MQEEMHLATDRVHRVGHFVLTAGGSDESVTIFAGRVAAPAADADGIAGYGGLASEREDIRIRVLPADEAIENALAGRYANSITVMALLWFAAKRDWLRAEWAA